MPSVKELKRIKKAAYKATTLTTKRRLKLKLERLKSLSAEIRIHMILLEILK